jgi:DNA-binding CsgD family transcriptional regulator
VVVDRLRAYRFAPSPSDAADADPGLSWRELQVLALLVEGKENMEIAQALSISLQTVKRHISRILAKLTSPTAPWPPSRLSGAVRSRPPASPRLFERTRGRMESP